MKYTVFEKVNKYHPDKVADRIAGAIVDEAYAIANKGEDNPSEMLEKLVHPHIAVEVLLGHGTGLIIIETDTPVEESKIEEIVKRIAGKIKTKIVQVEQDKHLNDNQKDSYCCGDNGIFKGVPTNKQENKLTKLARILDAMCKSDGKYIITSEKKLLQPEKQNLIICQSKLSEVAKQEIDNYFWTHYNRLIINPLGEWEGGTNVDSGATNRKLGSDMGRAATGGGLHGKDLTKADVSVNIVCHQLANKFDSEVTASCAIGSRWVKFYIKNANKTIEYSFKDILNIAYTYIVGHCTNFEGLAEYGLIR